MIKLVDGYEKKVRVLKGDMIEKCVNEVHTQISKYSDEYDSKTFLGILDTCKSWLQSQGLWNSSIVKNSTSS